MVQTVQRHAAEIVKTTLVIGLQVYMLKVVKMDIQETIALKLTIYLCLVLIICDVLTFGYDVLLLLKTMELYLFSFCCLQR